MPASGPTFETHQPETMTGIATDQARRAARRRRRRSASCGRSSTSRMPITAPSVPSPNPGGSGMKNGSDAVDAVTGAPRSSDRARGTAGSASAAANTTARREIGAMSASDGSATVRVQRAGGRRGQERRQEQPDVQQQARLARAAGAPSSSRRPGRLVLAHGSSGLAARPASRNARRSRHRLVAQRLAQLLQQTPSPRPTATPASRRDAHVGVAPRARRAREALAAQSELRPRLRPRRARACAPGRPAPARRSPRPARPRPATAAPRSPARRRRASTRARRTGAGARAR